jgi:hypothetical protein
MDTAYKAADATLGSRVDDIISNTDLSALDSFTEVKSSFVSAVLASFKSIYAKRNVATGNVDGANKSFTLTSGMLEHSEQVFLNGVLQDQTNDYAVSGTTLTMVAAPASGDLLEVFGVYGDMTDLDGTTSTIISTKKGK